MMLSEVAHVRTGDKGDVCQISVIAFDEADFPLIERKVTAERVRAHLKQMQVAQATRYSVPGIGALIFVLGGALRGGVTRSLALDSHGKTLGTQLLDLELGCRDDRSGAVSG